MGTGSGDRKIGFKTLQYELDLRYTLLYIQEGLGDADRLFSNVHCWVEMSNLNADLALCLRQFEQAHPGSIDFLAGFGGHSKCLLNLLGSEVLDLRCTSQYYYQFGFR